METHELVISFIKDCEDRGLSYQTRRTFFSYLKQFAAEFEKLPIDTRVIEAFLEKRGETPSHRGNMFKRLQSFYSYLERNDGIKSPIPPAGPIGRPRKFLH